MFVWALKCLEMSDWESSSGKVTIWLPISYRFLEEVFCFRKRTACVADFLRPFVLACTVFIVSSATEDELLFSEALQSTEISFSNFVVALCLRPKASPSPSWMSLRLILLGRKFAFDRPTDRLPLPKRIRSFMISWTVTDNFSRLSYAFCFFLSAA